MGMARVRWKQGQPNTIIGRIRNEAGTLITQASLSAIAWSSWDNRVVPSASIASGTLTIASVVFDTLQTNSVLWPIDTTGYNFLATIPATAFPSGDSGQEYRIELKFTETSGSKFTAEFSGPVDRILSSPL